MIHFVLRALSRCTLAMGLLLSALRAEAQQVVFSPYHQDGTYVPGEKIGWTVALSPGAAPPAGSYSYTIIKTGKSAFATGSFDLSSGSATIETVLREPAMLRVIVDYLAPPPPRQPSAAEIKQMNKAVRALIVKGDPSLKTVLDKYPDYNFISAARPSFVALMEDRVATLDAVVKSPKP